MYKFFLKQLIIALILIQSYSHAEEIEKFSIIGNNRVSSETIILFTELKVNQSIDDNILNDVIKKLYLTNFFENINLSFDNGILSIQVQELPIIQEIRFNGIKSKTQIENFKNNISLKEKNPFSENKILVDKNNILNLLKSSGYYYARIDVNIEKISKDIVNIVFDIDRGDKVTIKEIIFIGDKKIKDKKLFEIITSEEDRFWKFLSQNKYLNEERINLDKRLLQSYYLQNGYFNVKIEDVYSQLLNSKDFTLTYNISAGDKFYFGDFDLILPKDFDNKKFSELNKIFNKLKNTVYDFRKIDLIINEIEKISLIENYEFIDANVKEKIVNDKIYFSFEVFESRKTYVSRVNIFGNSTTKEEFIRNNLIVDEGDPFNKILQNKSINLLRSKGIFKSVNYELKSDGEKEILNLYLEEKPTGEISAAAGYGTDGATLSFGINEKNFRGEGIDLSTNISVGNDVLKGSIYYTQPNFGYTDHDLITSLENISNDKLDSSGYKSNIARTSIGTNYEQYQNIYFSPSLSISSEEVETSSKASTAYKKQEGTYFDTIFSYGLTYDQRNSPYQTSSGFISSWQQKLPLISDDGALYNSYLFTNYNEIADNVIFTTGFLVRSINSISNKDVRVSERLYIPASRLRGFESGKVGPKDGTDYVGGNYITTVNASSTIPYFFNSFDNFDLKFFMDAANIWGVDYSSSIDDQSKLRSSIGLAFEILSPVGPLSFSLAQPVSKASTDKTESFRFQLGTTF